MSGNEDKRVDSLILLLAATPPLSFATSAIVDGAQKVRDENGHLVWTTVGQMTSSVNLVMGVVAALLSLSILVASVKGRKERTPAPISPLVLSAFFVLIADALRHRSSITVFLYVVMSVLCLLACSLRSPTPSLPRRLAMLLIVVCVTSALYYGWKGEVAWTECRSDKCTPIGVLLHGYFPQENILAIYLSCLVPAVAWLRTPRLRNFALVAASLVIICTGSRGGYAALALSLVGYVLGRRVYLGSSFEPKRKVSLTSLVAAVPLITLAASLAVYLLASSSGFLTGRGFIYQITRAGVQKNPLIGPGREILTDAYLSSNSAGFQLAHEHGEAPYLLTNGGVVAFVLALAGFLWIFSRRANPTGVLVAAFSLAPAAAFVTEPTWEFSFKSPYLWTMCIVLSLTCLRSEREPVSAYSDAVGVAR